MWIGRRSERLLFLLWIFAKSGEKEKTVLIYNKVTNKYLSFKIFVLNILYLIRKFKPWVYRKKEGSCLVRTGNTWHWAGGQFLFCLHTGIWALPGCWACCLLLPAVAFLVARPEDFSWSKTIHWLPGVSSLLLRILVLLSHPCANPCASQPLRLPVSSPHVYICIVCFFSWWCTLFINALTALICMHFNFLHQSSLICWFYISSYFPGSPLVLLMSI